MEDNERMKGAAFTDLQNCLRRLVHPEIAATTARDEIDLRAFGRENVALYIEFDQERRELMAPLMACFFVQLFDVLVKEAKARPSNRLAVPLVLFLDEFGNIGQIPGVHRWMASFRKYGIGFVPVLQNLAQLDEVYGGPVGKGILANAGTRIALRGLELDDAKRFSEVTGEATALASSQGDSRDITLPRGPRAATGASPRPRGPTPRPPIPSPRSPARSPLPARPHSPHRMPVPPRTAPDPARARRPRRSR